MKIFGELSGDLSRIHIDRDFAQSNNFSSPVVYGALIVAKISYAIGMLLPGDLGLATQWNINFNKPLYVGQEAVMESTITHISPATHTVKLKTTVSIGAELIVSASIGSKILIA